MPKKNFRYKTFTARIKIKNLTLAQSIAIEDMMATWQQLGGLGCSRWTAFFADGDGNFRPKILYNGQKARFTDLIDDKSKWGGDKYKIDFDSISWKFHDQEHLREIEAKKFNIFRIILGTISDYITDIKYNIRLWSIRHANKKSSKINRGYDDNRPCDQAESDS